MIVGASIAIGAGVAAGARRGREPTATRGQRPARARRSRPLHLVIALGAAAFLAAHWATGLQDVWGRGMLTFDTLWYHGPFAARIAETGSVWGLHFTDPLYLNWFYPQNSELLHGAGHRAVRPRPALARSSTSAGSAWPCSPPGASAAPTASPR